MSQKVGIVTVTFNSGRVIEPFLDCIGRLDGVEWILFIVDNDSTDGTRELVSRAASPRIQVVLCESNLGVAEGNNIGIRLAMAAGCGQILLLNNDTEFEPTLVKDLQTSLRRCSADAVTPAIAFHDQPSSVWFSGGSFRYFWGVDARHDATRPYQSGAFQTSYAPTCCMLIRREVFDRVGMMDDAYFVYWDDTDFCLRMRRSGLKLFCDTGIVMTHKVSSITGGTQSTFFIRYHHRNQIYYARKHYGRAMVAYTTAMASLKALLRLAIRRDRIGQTKLRFRSMREGFSIPVPVRGKG